MPGKSKLKLEDLFLPQDGPTPVAESAINERLTRLVKRCEALLEEWESTEELFTWDSNREELLESIQTAKEEGWL